MTREKRHVYVTTMREGSALVGVVRCAVTGEVVATTHAINPPHVKVALARAAELFREHTDAWHLVSEPKS